MGVKQSVFEERLKRFVEQLAGAEEGSVTRATLLFDGLIDSIRVLDLIAFVESSLGTTIPDEKIRLENFRNVRAIGEAFVLEEQQDRAS